MQALEFQLTREDWRAYLAYAAPRWWDFRAGWFVVLTIAIGAAFGVFESATEIRVNSYVFVVLLFVLIALIGKAAEMANRRLKLARWKAPTGPTRVAFSDAGIVVAQDGAEHDVSWDVVHEVVVQDAFVFLAAMREEDRILIPLRAFADRDAMFRFAAECDARIKADEERREQAEEDYGDELGDDAQIKLPDHPHVVDIALNADDWPAVNAELNRGKRTLTLAQSALLTTSLGGVITGGLAAIYATLVGPPLEWATWAAFAWPGAVGLSWLGARAYDKAQRKLLETNAAHHLNYQITLDASGVTRRGQGVTVHLDWASIARIELKGASILFGTPWNEFFIAPQHCFAQPQDYWDFLSAAASWQRAARQAASTAPPETKRSKPDSEARSSFAIRSERLEPESRTVEVGVRDAGRAQPDEMIFIDRNGQPFMRVNLYYPAQDYHLRTAVDVWRDWIVVGFGARVALISCSDGAQRSIALSQSDPPDSLDYFCRIEATPAYLLVSSGRRVFRIGDDGEVLWRSAEVGLDGVIIWSDDDAGVVHGSGEWDPPGGWRDFRLATETGLQIP